MTLQGEPRYVGAPWRSRFLRAPKAALRFASLPGFVPVADLATVRLGAKTGCDRFFFVTRVGGEPEADVSLLSSPRAAVRVRGLDGWEGWISRRDLRPAVLNPHHLWAGSTRRFVIPRDGDRYYLFPEQKAVRADLAQYAAFAEVQGVHRGTLVRSNGTPNRWFKQARVPVSSEWALPYNSAYDYGAWDNRAQAVLNGRFVGVEARPGVDSDLLGAALNTTMAAAARLIEGKATGVEGAFDVGPPAVRRMTVPDVRRVDARGAAAIREVLGELRAADAMPAAPGRDAKVNPIRHRLDLVVLIAIGFTRGEASVLTSELYESYARWRSVVEDVEMMMRQNRRVMSATGQTRSARPSDLAARRVWEEIEHQFSIFPSDLLTSSDPLQAYALPTGIEMPFQEPLFDGGKVTIAPGKIVDLGSYDRVRYAAMLSTIGFESPLEIPEDSRRCGGIVDRFIAENRRLRAEAAHRAKGYVGAHTGSFEAVVDAVEKAWFRKMRAIGMRVKPSTTDLDVRAN